MPKIKSNFFISFDGVVESHDKWHFPYFDDQMGARPSARSPLLGRGQQVRHVEARLENYGWNSR